MPRPERKFQTEQAGDRIVWSDAQEASVTMEPYRLAGEEQSPIFQNPKERSTMAETYSPVRLRTADLKIISSRQLSPHEVCPLIQVVPEQVESIARREFRIDEIQSHLLAAVACDRSVLSPGDD